jgi:hypothetical protein
MARGYKISGGGRVRFAGAMAGAREQKNELVDNKGVRKKDVEIEEIEIPTAKSELVPFLNDLVKEVENSFELGDGPT